MEIKHFPYGVVQEFESKLSDSKVSLLATQNIISQAGKNLAS